MSIGQGEVERIADLARLELSGPEVERITRDLGLILRHFQTIRELDQPESRGVTPPEGTTSLREDRPDPGSLELDLGTIAPEWLDGFFLIPRLRELGGSSPGGDADGAGGSATGA